MRAALLCGLFLGAFLAAAEPVSPAAENASPDRDPKVSAWLADARRWLEARQPAATLGICDQVEERYRAVYPPGSRKVYCARNPAETLALLTEAASRGEKALVLGPNWSSARFLKAYALVELRRPQEALVAVKAALELSPWNAQYLCELGAIEVSFKNWPGAQAAYRQALDRAGLSPEEKKGDVARARRGLGYVLVEMGDLTGAAKMYEQCLQDDPKDERARRELEYVRQRMK